MKICVLQPDYSTSGVDYRLYDPPRELGTILAGHSVDHVALNKATTYRQLKELARGGYDIFINLCEGYPEWDVPSVDVIETFERLGLPYTGPTPMLYDQPKAVGKYVAWSVGVATPAHVLISDPAAGVASAASLRFPLFVKPSHAGDSLGVDDGALVHDVAALRLRVASVVTEFGEALVEEYVDGREFTVLVVASPDEGVSPTALLPVEYIFPPGYRFKTYSQKTSDLHPEANIPVTDASLVGRLQDAAVKIFEAFSGVGYGRLDLRQDASGEIYFLEINFTCSVFYPEGSEGSADHILKYDGLGQSGFAERIIAEGIARHRRSRKVYAVCGSAVSGYGILATMDIAAGAIVYRGEGKAQRLVTRRHAEHWRGKAKVDFSRYAYPLSDELFMLWDQDPAEWAPQNHSCEANTKFDGLNLIAVRAIKSGEELTLDYADFMSEAGQSFQCSCGAPSCRGRVSGVAGNSVTMRERARRSAR